MVGEGPAVMLWWWVRRWVVVGWCERVVFWRMRDGGRVSGKREKRENGSFWLAGGEWVGRRKAGGGVSVVGEVVGGVGLGSFGFGEEKDGGARMGGVYG
jgi:hypothetical protein